MKPMTISQNVEIISNGNKILLEKGDKITIEARQSGPWDEEENQAAYRADALQDHLKVRERRGYDKNVPNNY